MSKNKRKKKIKRTPQQLQKIHQKRLMAEERNRVKRKLEKEQKKELQMEQTNNILSQLSEDDWNDMWFHITHSKFMDSIQKDGLKGGSGKKWGDVKGSFYMTNKEDRELWNAIGSQYVIDFEIDDFFERMGDKDVLVIGIPKKVFQLIDCPILEDKGGESMNYDHNHIKVLLGKKVISPSLFKVVDEFRTDLHKYETSSVWKYIQLRIERDSGDLLDLNDVRYEDGMLGSRTYQNRFETSSKKLFSHSYEYIQSHMRMLNQNRMLNGTSSIFDKDIQSGCPNLQYSEVA